MRKEFMTKLTHLGNKMPDSVSPPKVLPIYMSSVFSFDDVETLDAVYAKEAEGYVYSRMSNPVHDSLAEMMAAIEEGQDARVYSSGMAAITMSIMAHVKAGDHIIADRVLYGGSFQFLKDELKKLNIEVTFLDFQKDDIEKYFRSNTTLVYMETISNPLMNVLDIQKYADMAHSHGTKLIVDNTFATPVICQPLKLGADIVVYSATKYICGHSDVIGGVVVSDKNTMEKIHQTASIYGPTMSPFDAWILIRSLRTLELRMKQHSENAMKLATFLEKQPQVRKVYYPGLQSSSTHDIAKETFFNNLYGGMMSIDLAGGEKAAFDLIRSLESIKFLPSLASFSTSMSYPAKTSHRGMPEEEREKAGITMGLLRISVGLESTQDLIEEFEKALKTI
ncbi:aminotransferase class I/II-fold pyridoxal phosphate-dependent enzyme [Irregularibacter muris]|uniref:homocysteine desulfhydrase n=1 Tax=Irregularibacter muris TaxID=1796619 RepID=A0AAE3HE49_9FIRM|nr:aminotransferase class I/II-fold pyridoxal phosphate-dependent enzyme [Irregularibacter muris]MCR1898797.1 aminotransferase class I/II-fold pyridoxal phosphate-dependent enzyme [Irregularibacter muris]